MTPRFIEIHPVEGGPMSINVATIDHVRPTTHGAVVVYIGSSVSEHVTETYDQLLSMLDVRRAHRGPA